MLMQSLYTMRALVGLVDHAYYSCGPALRWGSPTCLALIALLQRFYDYKNTLPVDDSLNLDPAVVR